ncbi:MAG: response regulator [Pseudomonadota bacterium]
MSKNRQSILVVEDNLVNQKIILAMLAKLGYRADVAANGEQAVQCVQAQRYGLIFMDCQMPVMDGYAAAQAIRRLDAPGARRVPIVVLSANSAGELAEQCNKAGIDDYMVKPIEYNVLREKLAQWLKAGPLGS